MKNLLQNFLREEDGQDMVEYALVVGVIALGAVAGMQGVAASVTTMFNTLAGRIDTAVNPA